jgi:C4-type Zn-finger protein
MAVGQQTLTCEECGGEMEVEKEWTRRTIPLVGSEVEVREYLCRNCGMGQRLQRKEGEEEWERVSP